MPERPFPKSEAEISALMNLWVVKLQQYAPQLGISPAALARLQNDTLNFDYIKDYTLQITAAKESVTDWKEAMYYSDDTDSNPAPPEVNPATLPEAGQAGIVTMFHKLWRQVKAAPAYTEQIGEDLDIVVNHPYEPEPETLMPSIHAESMPAGEVKLTFQKMGQSSVQIQYRLKGTQEWLNLGRFTTSPVLDTPFKGVGNDEPKAVEYRCRLVNKDKEVGEFSDIATVVTRP